MSDISANNKRIAKNTLLLYVRMLFLMLISLYTSRVTLNVLGVEDFGIYNVVGGVITLFAFVNGSLSDSTRRFLTFEIGRNDINSVQKVFSTSLYIYIAFVILLFLIAETFGLWFLHSQLNIPTERFYAAQWVYQFSTLSVLISIFVVPYTADIIAHEKMDAFAYLSILEAILRLGVVFILLKISFDKLIAYSILQVFVQVFILAFYVIYCRRHFIESKVLVKIDRIKLKKMTSFMGWTMTGAVASMFSGQGLNMLLNIFFGPTVNAARGIAVHMQAFLTRFCSNFQTAINPQITKTYASGELSVMHNLVIFSSKYSFYLLLVLSLPIYVALDFILKLWLGIVPDHTATFFRLIIIVSLMSVLSNAMVASIHATGDLKKFQIIVEAVNIMVLPISYIFLKMGIKNPSVVYWVYAIISIVAQIVRVYIVLPKIQMSYKRYINEIVIPIFKVVFVSGGLCWICYKFVRFNQIIDNILVIIISFIIVIITTYYIGMRVEERRKVKEIIKKKING